MDVATNFFKDKLNVKPYPYGNIKFPSSWTDCLDYTVPDFWKETGAADSDMHIWVTAADSSESWVANAGACVIRNNADGNPYPVMGRIQFNLRFIKG